MITLRSIGVFFGLFLTFTLSAEETLRDSLQKVLDRTTESRQRIDLLINILDLSDSGDNEFEVARQLYREARQADDKFAIAASLGPLTIGYMGVPDHRDSLFYVFTEAEKQLADSPEDGVVVYYRMVYKARELATTDREHRHEVCNRYLKELDAQKEDNRFQEVARLFLTGSIHYLLISLTETGSEGAIPFLEEAWKKAADFPPLARKNFQGNIYILLSSLYNDTRQYSQLVELSNDYLNMLDAYFSQDLVKHRRPYFYKDNLYLLCYQILMSNQELIGKEKARMYYRRFCDYMQHGKGDALQRNKLYFYHYSYSYFMNQGEFAQALACSDSLIGLIEKSKSVNLQYITHYKGRAKALKKMGRIKDACNAYERAIKVSDSLTRKEQLKSISELQVGYEVDKLKLRKVNLSARNHQVALICSAGLLLLMTAFGFYSYFNLKHIRKLQAELLRQKQEAQKSEQMKAAFINSVCHEVRTPLNSIVGFSELIAEEETEDKKENYVQIIRESCGQLTYLLDDMLEVAYLENLTTPLPPEEIQAGEICREQLNRLPSKNKVTYTDEITEEVRLRVNRKYFSLMLQTLLNNAYKFTHEGYISIMTRSEGRQTHIYITDTGCGIPADKQEYVFERFTKLNSFTQGNGLGLYLCRLIAGKLNATVRIDPAYTAGTRVILTFFHPEENDCSR